MNRLSSASVTEFNRIIVKRKYFHKVQKVWLSKGFLTYLYLTKNEGVHAQIDAKKWALYKFLRKYHDGHGYDYDVMRKPCNNKAYKKIDHKLFNFIIHSTSCSSECNYCKVVNYNINKRAIITNSFVQLVTSNNIDELMNELKLYETINM